MKLILEAYCVRYYCVDEVYYTPVSYCVITPDRCHRNEMRNINVCEKSSNDILKIIPAKSVLKTTKFLICACWSQTPGSKKLKPKWNKMCLHAQVYIVCLIRVISQGCLRYGWPSQSCAAFHLRRVSLPAHIGLVCSGQECRSSVPVLGSILWELVGNLKLARQGLFML